MTNMQKEIRGLLECFCRDTTNGYPQEQELSIKTVKKYKKYFVATSKKDRIFFNIIICNLFPLYKWLYKIFKK